MSFTGDWVGREGHHRKLARHREDRAFRRKTGPLGTLIPRLVGCSGSWVSALLHRKERTPLSSQLTPEKGHSLGNHFPGFCYKRTVLESHLNNLSLRVPGESHLSSCQTIPVESGRRAEPRRNCGFISESDGALEVSALRSCGVTDRNASTSSVLAWRRAANQRERAEHAKQAAGRKGHTVTQLREILQLLTKLCYGLPIVTAELPIVLRTHRAGRVPVRSPGWGHAIAKGSVPKGFYIVDLTQRS